MGSFYSAVMTNAGAELLAQALAGTATLEFTSMKTGNGTYDASERTTAALQERTALKSLKQSFEFTGSATLSDTGIALTAIITNADVVEGYYINEVGIYCRNAQVAGSEPILYSIAVAEVADYLPPYNGSAPTTITQSYYVTVSNSANVQIIVAEGAYTLNYDEDNSMLQLLLDGEVVSEVEIQGGGSPTKSTLTLWTEDENMYGATGSVVISGTTYNFTLPSAGGSINITVRQTGTATITAAKGEFSFETTLAMTTFGPYNQEITSGDAYEIDITTSESTLIGQTVTATYDTDKTKTATISAQGEATITIYNYTGDVNLSATDGDETATAKVTLVSGTSTYSADLSFAKIYGISWDGSSSSAWTRTDAAELFTDPVPAINNGDGSSPFDDILPWSGMEIVDDATAGKLVKIPKYYYKWAKTGTAMTLQISTKQYDGFLCSPAHADRGDGNGERDYVYVGRYHCATSTYKSTTGVAPANNLTRADFRTNIHNLGSDIWQFDYAMLWTIRMLYLVEYADWNSQTKIGYGCGNNSAAENAGLTDAMTYHTGTNAANRTTYGHTQYRHIEDLWGNVYDWCDGIYFSTQDVNAIRNPANFSDTTGGTKIATRPTTSGVVTEWTIPTQEGYEGWLYAKEAVADSTYSTYDCDHCDYSASDVVLLVGGSYGQHQDRGLFCMNDYSVSVKNTNVGSRLQKLPA